MTQSANSLLRDFIPEARDLLEQAGRSLLALEREPNTTEPMNALFRAVHTLKGTSGLFEIGPLTRVVHAAEDLLSAVQSGEIHLAAETADVLLDALDQVSAWIDGLAQAGQLPPTAEAGSAARVQRLRAPLAPPNGGALPGSKAAAGVPAWVTTLTAKEQRACGESDLPIMAISYAPDAHCFFRGEDPLALMRQIGGLRLLRAEPLSPWPALDEVDPFFCNLKLYAIAEASSAEPGTLFQYVSDQVEIVALPAGWPDSDTMCG